jgi:hypothetical protein
MGKLAYQKLREELGQRGGSMSWERRGYRYGAWIVTRNGKQRIIEAEGRHYYPDLDPLHIPRVPNPRENWDDYTDEPIEGAADKLLATLT